MFYIYRYIDFLDIDIDISDIDMLKDLYVNNIYIYMYRYVPSNRTLIISRRLTCKKKMLCM